MTRLRDVIPLQSVGTSSQSQKRYRRYCEIQEYENLKNNFINRLLMIVLPVEDYSEIEWLKREIILLFGRIPGEIRCRPEEFIEEELPVKPEEAKTYLSKIPALYKLGNYWTKHSEPVEAPSHGRGNKHFLELVGLLKERLESGEIPQDARPVTQDGQNPNEVTIFIGKDGEIYNKNLEENKKLPLPELIKTVNA